MARRRINISIDEDLDRRWTKVVKRYGWTKSGMLDDLLREVLPKLESVNPKDVIKSSLITISQSLAELSKVIDEAEKDK